MALEKMHFTSSEGVEIVVPFMKNSIRRKHMNRINKEFKGDDKSGMDSALFEAAGFDKKTMDAIDDLLIGDYQKFTEEWTQQDDVTVGE